MDRLVLPESLMIEMVEHARRCLPDEGCGMLAGKGGRISRVYALNNSNPSPATYVIDTADQIRSIRDMAARGLELIAIYHSHPDSLPLPSMTDINRAFFPGTRELNYPGVAYVIIGLSGPAPEVKAYTIEAGGVRPLEITPN